MAISGEVHTSKLSLALFSSRACPATLILASQELAYALRKAALPVIGGFHSPVEQMILRELLRGYSSIEVCPARAVDGMRIPREWHAAVSEGRLLISSLCRVRRMTAASAAERNRYVVERSRCIFVVYTSPGGALEQLILQQLAAGRRIYTWGSPFCEPLLSKGATPVPCDTDGIRKFVEAQALA